MGRIAIVICVLFCSVDLLFSTTGVEYLQKGINYLEKADFTNAISQFLMALSKGLSSSDSITSYICLGICSSAAGDPSETTDNFQRALAINPNFDLGTSSLKDYANQSIIETFKKTKRTLMGMISVTSEPPGLDVLVDNLPKGKTPLIIDNMVAGKHKVKIGPATKIVEVQSGLTREVAYTFTKPANVRETPCIGLQIDNSSFYYLSYRKWLSIANSAQINLGVTGLSTPNIDITTSITYLRHIFPDYDTPLSLVWGSKIDWTAIRYSSEIITTGKSVILSLVAGSEYYFKKAPVALNTQLEVLQVLQISWFGGFHPVFFAMIPRFSIGVSYYF